MIKKLDFFGALNVILKAKEVTFKSYNIVPAVVLTLQVVVVAAAADALLIVVEEAEANREILVIFL